MPICRLCDSDRKLVKAHIIPEAFFRELRGEGPTLLSVPSDPGRYAKRTPIGVYDTGILCAHCEGRFQDWDQYGAELLIHKRDTDFKEHRTPLGQLMAYFCDSYDYAKLKLFFISVLWRASVSTQDYFNRISLGPYEELAKGAILTGDPGPADSFSVVISRWIPADNTADVEKAILNPFREHFDGVSSVRMYFGRFVAYIKTDKRRFQPPLDLCVMTNGVKLAVVARKLEGSNDFQALSGVIRNLPR